METSRLHETNLGYLKALIDAGIDGIAAARREHAGGIFHPPLRDAVWPSLAIGATAGALGAGLAGRRKRSTMVMGTVVGSMVGVGAALAWASRGFAGSAARRAAQCVNASRDDHWLQSHPIDYA